MNARSAGVGVLGVLAGGVLLAGFAGPASAFAASPWWHLTSGSRPTEVQPGGSGQIVVTASNLGDADANGGSEPVKIADKLPAGLSATGVEGFVEEEKPGGGSERIALTCSSMPLQCSYAGILAPYRQLQVLIDVDAEPGAFSGEVNEATVSGGEALSASASRGVLIGDGVPFGLEAYEMDAEEQDGGADTQAGSHPFQLTTALTFDQTSEPGEPPALAKDLRLELPAGLIANSTPFPQCTLTWFVTSSDGVDECPAQTALGVASVTVDDPADFGPAPVTLTVPVFSLEPAVGEPARFGFDVVGVSVLLTGENGLEVTRSADFRLPMGIPAGPLNLTVSDANGLNLPELMNLVTANAATPEALIRELNAIRPSDRAYVRVWRAQPSYPVSGRELGDPPPSISLVMTRGMSAGPALLLAARGTTLGEMVLDPGDYVVTGAKTIQVEVKP